MAVGAAPPPALLSLFRPRLLSLLFLVLPLSRASAQPFPGPSIFGCSQEGCDPSRSFHAPVVGPLPLHPGTQILWRDPDVTLEEGAWGCASDGTRAVCSWNDDQGLAEYDLASRGKGWTTGIIGSAFSGSSPLLTSAGGDFGDEYVVGMDNDTFAVLNAANGIVTLAAKVGTAEGTGLPKVPVLGPTLLQQEGSGDRVVLLVDQSGKLVAWSVSLGFCWASAYLCPPGISFSDCQSEPERGYLRPISTPALNSAATVAYIGTQHYFNGSHGNGYLVSLKAGGISSRLHVLWTMEFDHGYELMPGVTVADNIVMVHLCRAKGKLLKGYSCNLTAIEDVDSTSGKIIWSTVVLETSERLPTPSELSIALDPRGGVWAWTFVELRRLKVTTGDVIQRIEASDLGGEPVSHFLISFNSSSAAPVLFGAFAQAKRNNGFEVVAINLTVQSKTVTSPQPIEILWKIGLHGSPPGQVTIISSMAPNNQNTSSSALLVPSSDGLVVLG